MAKKIILEPGRTFSEFSLLTGHTGRNCKLTDVTLQTSLTEKLMLKLPLLSAAMTSVTGYEMALALGKEGGLGILPARLPIEEQAEMVRKIKEYEMGFVEEPITARENATVEKILKLIEQYGHSKIPIINRNNTFLGMFIQQHYWQTDAALQDRVGSAMIRFDSEQIPFCNKPDITVDEAKDLLKSNQQRYLVVLDHQNRLVKLAFEKDIEKIKVGSAISTYKGWQERAKENIAAGADLIVIDTSDAHSDFVLDVIKEYKSMALETPLCVGNIITYEGALCLMQQGADILKVGMSGGSICTTQRQKATGRAPMSALMDASRAREDHFEKSKRYAPVVMDGGIASPADMIIALTLADAIMMGNYFNRFYESGGEKLDKDGKITRDENEMVSVATWGEGSIRAQNLDRYGHSTRKTFFEEGMEGTVPYLGRLKPTLKKDMMKIKAALSNAGCVDLKEFRNNAVIELNSPHSRHIVGDVHDISIKGSS
jgi:IMP dehydrogenase